MGHPGKVQVAVIRGGNHRGAVAQAISLLNEELSRQIAPNPLIIPSLSFGARLAGSTHRDAISATVDALLGAGAESITIAAGAANSELRATRKFQELGYQAEVWNRPVSFLDLGNDAEREIVTVDDARSDPLELQIPDAVKNSGCRVSLAVARSRYSFGAGLGVANLLSALDFTDRTRLLPGAATKHASLFGFLASFFPRSSAAITDEARLIVSLLKSIQPNFSIVDSFAYAKRSIPQNGRRTVFPGYVFAGTDPVAVDTVAGMVLGYGRKKLAYLSLAESMGLGVADLSRIEIIGDRAITAIRTSAHLLRMHRRSRQQWAATSKSRSR